MNSKNSILIVLGVLIIIVGGFYLYQKSAYSPTQADFKNISYEIEGRQVTLKNGLSEIELVPGSASKITTKYFGNEVVADLNGDQNEDRVFLLTQDGGGSGTFYYVVAAIKTVMGYVGTNAISLGDRISPQSTEFRDNKIIVNYFERKDGEAMITKPSVAISRYFKIMNNKLVEFNVLSQLINREWKWVNTQINNDEIITSKKQDAFRITFTAEGTVNGKTDCNNFSGQYSVSDNKLSLSSLASTEMYCEGSQEAVFTKALSEIESYFIRDNKLVLEMKLDSGVMLFE